LGVEKSVGRAPLNRLSEPNERGKKANLVVDCHHAGRSELSVFRGDEYGRGIQEFALGGGASGLTGKHSGRANTVAEAPARTLVPLMLRRR
jgi:hypothetical protein